METVDVYELCADLDATIYNLQEFAPDIVTAGAKRISAGDAEAIRQAWASEEEPLFDPEPELWDCAY